MRVRRSLLWSAFLAAACLGAVGWAGATELPAPVAEGLTGHEPGFIVRLHPAPLSAHPVVLTARDHLGGDERLRVTGPATVLIMQMVEGIQSLGLDPEAVEELWWSSGSETSGLWLRSGLEGDVLDDALNEAGWIVDEGAQRDSVLVRISDADRVEERDILDAIEDESERAGMARIIEMSRPRIARCGSSWLVSMRHGAGATEQAELCGGALIDIDETPSFPRDVLLRESKRILATIAIDVPGNDLEQDHRLENEEGNTAEAAGERERLLLRLRELESPENGMFRQLGDIAAVVSEVDGGLVLDLVARRPDGERAEETQRFLRMLVLGMRFAVAPTAPELDRDLGNAVINVEGDAVRATCTFSQAALTATLERESERRRAAAELRQKLEALDAAEPPTGSETTQDD